MDHFRSIALACDASDGCLCVGRRAETNSVCHDISAARRWLLPRLPALGAHAEIRSLVRRRSTKEKRRIILPTETSRSGSAASLQPPIYFTCRTAPETRLRDLTPTGLCRFYSNIAGHIATMFSPTRLCSFAVECLLRRCVLFLRRHIHAFNVQTGDFEARLEIERRPSHGTEQ